MSSDESAIGLALIDTHAHLQVDAFEDDRDDVLARARQNGVCSVVVPGIDVESCRQALAIANREPGVVVAVGVHPQVAGGLSDLPLGELRQLVHQPGVVAIGEIGLDYFRDYGPRHRQIAALEEQLGLASACGLPAIIHNRAADEDTLAVLQSWLAGDVKNRAVLHCFTGDAVFADRALRAGLHLGFGGVVTFPREVELRRIVATVPIDRILVETDSPYLAPRPFRGRRNEPANVRLVAAALAQALMMDEVEIAARTTANASAFFGLELNGC